MISIPTEIADILEKKEKATLQVETLGYFRVAIAGEWIEDAAWKRDIASQLFQYFITIRHQRALHKMQIQDRIWSDLSEDAGSRNFKTALHSISKVIEPDKPSRAESSYIIRQGLTYRLNMDNIWTDVDALDELIILGNQNLKDAPSLAAEAYRHAIEHYQGEYLPNRIFEDWSADERERIQVLVLGAMMTLAKLKLKEHPKESIRLSKQALLIDATWEEAYRIQMEAYMAEGNRPLAVKTYRKCEEILKKEFEIEPLPETTAYFKKLNSI